ncbi:CgeB family protein [Sphingomonas sp. ID0503]|uniref:CgeB family protein n=1 Tax=Sphingomonas sp. ID0503 TaxID=3399691 RepID=UPI003AFA267D
MNVTGVLEPFYLGTIRGWAPRNTAITVTLDGAPLAEVVAAAPRLFVGDMAAAGYAGFEIAAPPTLSDGQPHVLRAYETESGRDLDFSPMTIRAGGWGGGVTGVEGRSIRGHAVDWLAVDRPVLVAAIAGSDILATALARPAGDGPVRDGHPFTLTLPPEVETSGAAVVHVVIVGADRSLSGSPVIVAQKPRAPAAALQRRAAQPLSMAIQVSAPNIRVAHEWGDYHYAQQLGRSLDKLGVYARTQCHDEWTSEGFDIVLNLRGRQRFIPDPAKINLLWVISHPDRLGVGEMDQFDHIFVAAAPHAQVLAKDTHRPVTVLHQATDPEVFHPVEGEDDLPSPAVLFVGNSRREYRTMVKWCVEQDINVTVFGSLWKDVIPPKYIAGDHLPNDEVHRWYGSAEVLLNDHWQTMLSGGFLSNRLFDGSAAGAFIITDPVAGLAEVFGDSIETAETPEELKAKIDHYRAHPEERRAKAEAARAIVLAQHTFDHRAATILEVVEALRNKPRLIDAA